MHRYLRAIGFDQPMSREEFNQLCKSIEQTADRSSFFQREDGTVFAEVEKEIAHNMGICLRGEYTEEGEFLQDYYFPYLLGTGLSMYESVQVEQHAEKESYAGVCEDLTSCLNLIFYLQNAVDYKKEEELYKNREGMFSVTLSGLSIDGKILLPHVASKKQVVQPVFVERMELLNRAKNGDEDAIEDLALEDMDVYNSLNKRIKNEDLYSIVESTFMPCGVECDQYAVFGTIQELELVKNLITGSTVYRMTVECNHINLDLVINASDLLGEPKIGRRFKGTIWLQGYVMRT